MIDTKNMNLNELSTATRENLESLGYGLRTIQMVNSIWKDLSQFLGSRIPTCIRIGISPRANRLPGMLVQKTYTQ